MLRSACRATSILRKGPQPVCRLLRQWASDAPGDCCASASQLTPCGHTSYRNLDCQPDRWAPQIETSPRLSLSVLPADWHSGTGRLLRGFVPAPRNAVSTAWAGNSWMSGGLDLPQSRLASLCRSSGRNRPAPGVGVPHGGLRGAELSAVSVSRARLATAAPSDSSLKCVSLRRMSRNQTPTLRAAERVSPANVAPMPGFDTSSALTPSAQPPRRSHGRCLGWQSRPYSSSCPSYAERSP